MEGNVLFMVIWRQGVISHQTYGKGRKEMFYLTTHSTHFYLWLYGVRHMVTEGRKEMFYLTIHSTHFI